MQQLSKIYATTLIKALAEQEFRNNSNLLALFRAEIFYSEIFELFARFNYAGIISQKLFEILDVAQINKSDKKRLEAIFNLYKKFGETLEKYNYEMPQYKIKNSNTPNDLNLWAKNLACNQTIEFEDIQNEIVYICKEIKQQVENGAKYCDFGIYLTNKSYKHAYLQLMNALDIPTNYKILDEKTIKFRIELEQFLNYCKEPNELILANLNKKDDEVLEIFNDFKRGDYCKIISELANFNTDEINKKVSAFENFCKNIIGKNAPFEKILAIVDSHLYDEKPDENVVFIFSCPNKKFKKIYIPSLIETTFLNKEYIYFISQKSNNMISNLIQRTAPKFEKIIPDKDVSIDFKTFEDVVKCGDELYLSTFNYSESKQVRPSVLFELFKNYAAFKSHKNNVSNEKDISVKNAATVNASKIIEDKETLRLNPSAIANFQSCPKKYFFKNLLRLKEQNAFLASYGSIVHSILEIFNKNFLNNYTKEKIIELCDILFSSKNSPNKTLEAGFSEIDVELVKSTDELTLAQMRDNFYNAVENLEENNFFKAPDETNCEIEFDFELDNVIYNCRIDCIKKDGENCAVIDYKTGKDKKKNLEYYASGKGLALEDDYEFQIPIYFLGTQYSKTLQKFQVSDFALEYIRPDDYKKDMVKSKRLKEVEKQIVEKLKNVANEIKNSEEFLAKPEHFKCLNCSYAFLCDGIEDSD